MTNPKHGETTLTEEIASRQWLDSFQKRSLTKEIFGALQSAAEEGWKAGMEEAARLAFEHWKGEHEQENYEIFSPGLVDAIRSKITDSTPTPCRGK